MGITSFVRRKIFLNIHPLIKRVLLPSLLMLFVLQLYTRKGDIITGPDVLPGEALDPIVRHKSLNPVDQRPKQPFETVVNAAADIDEKSDDVVETKKEEKKKSDKEKKMDEYVKKNAKKNKVEEKKDKKEEWSMNKLNVPGKEYVDFDGHKITERTVTLTIMSSEDKVFMSINKREIYRGLEERGMHIVVLHPHTGEVVAKKAFDTFFNGTEIEMVEFLDNVKDGRIIAFAVRDEAASGLTWKGRSKLKEFGAKFADQLSYRDMWILVTRKGGMKMAESYSNVAVEDTGYEFGGPLFLRTDFDLNELSDHCDWKGKENEPRQQFCQKYDGYGKMCRCEVKKFEHSFNLVNDKVHEELRQSEFLNRMTVAVMAHSNPHYLYKTLKALSESPGYNSDRVVVYLEDSNSEMVDLMALFGVKYAICGVRNGNVTEELRIRDKIQYIFRDILGASFDATTVPEGLNDMPAVPSSPSDYVLILDDDVRVSVDFYKFLHGVGPILSKDSTVFGVSAFNYNSFASVSGSLTTFYRSDRPNHLSLMVPAKSVHEHLVKNWPDVKSDVEWYESISKSMLNSKMDIIIPAVSRAKHVGYSGFKIKGTAQKLFFQDHVVSDSLDYQIEKENIDRLVLESYKSWREESIKRAEPLTFDFCEEDLPRGKKPYVVYVDYSGELKDDSKITNLFRCLGTWNVYVEGGWKNTWDFVYHDHPLTVVATPSHYSHFKPEGYTPIEYTPTKSTS